MNSMIYKKNYENIFFMFLFLLPFTILSQTPGELISVRVSASVQVSPAQIELSWESSGVVTSYDLYRRPHTMSNWGSPIANLGSTITTYVDNNVVVGEEYEYQIVKNGADVGYGYINVSIEKEEVHNNGILIMVVEDSYSGNTLFDSAIQQTIEDISHDGWVVKQIYVNAADPVSQVKQDILDVYNENTSLTKAIYLIGHVPVPYSGLLNPDAHPDHLGAWPTDLYYADVNGSWTDVSVNDNTSASSSRNHNVPGDGKFDQGVLPSSTELQIGRIDFSDLSNFSESEEELIIKYLNKVHQYKTKMFTAADRALVDDNFTGIGEGFSASGYRNFSTMFGGVNIDNSLDYRTTLNNESYMWSYGCGAGSFTSCQGVGTSSDLAGDSLQTIFTMLFGSYFGDWDNSNNFLRTTLAQGQTLCAFWAGRPQWYVHHMSTGSNIGFGAHLSQNNNGLYQVSTIPFFAKWIHISLLGDPTVRMHYIQPASDLILAENGSDIELNWTASPENVLGYNIYRLDPDNEFYVKLNNGLVSATNYIDQSISSSGYYKYFVRAVKKQTTSSGVYYNQSLAISGEIQSTLNNLEKEAGSLSLYPNPTRGVVHFSINIDKLEICSIDGKLIDEVRNIKSYDISKYESGLLIFRIYSKGKQITKRVILQ